MIVDVLATARITRLVTRDRVLRPLRDRVNDAELHGFLPLGAGEFVECPWCVSVWAAAAVLTARTFAPHTWRKVAWLLAASEVAGFLIVAPETATLEQAEPVALRALSPQPPYDQRSNGRRFDVAGCRCDAWHYDAHTDPGCPLFGHVG